MASALDLSAIVTFRIWIISDIGYVLSVAERGLLVRNWSTRRRLWVTGAMEEFFQSCARGIAVKSFDIVIGPIHRPYRGKAVKIHSILNFRMAQGTNAIYTTWTTLCSQNCPCKKENRQRLLCPRSKQRIALNSSLTTPTLSLPSSPK